MIDKSKLKEQATAAKEWPSQCMELFNSIANPAAILELLEELAQAEQSSNVLPPVAAPVSQHGANASAWISVKDRLPNHRQTVAFVAKGSGEFSYVNGRVFGGAFSNRSTWLGGGFNVPGLTLDASHWMPLPPAPEQSEASGSREGRDAQQNSANLTPPATPTADVGGLTKEVRSIIEDLLQNSSAPYSGDPAMDRDFSRRYNEAASKALALLATKAAQEAPILSADDVQWVVNDIAELGVKIGNQFFFLYKGSSLVYEDATHDNGSPMYWRPVFKREFGECAHPINHADYSKIGTVSLSDSEEWKPLSASPAPSAKQEPQEQAPRPSRNAALRPAPAMPVDAGFAVPAGYKLVPVEPTPEMVEAGARDGVRGDFDNDLSNGVKELSRRLTASSYAAMLAASPVPPALAPAVPNELERTQRMFMAACADLGAINEALGLDPDDGGAAPILKAIAELKAQIATPAAHPSAQVERAAPINMNTQFLVMLTAYGAQARNQHYAWMRGQYPTFAPALSQVGDMLTEPLWELFKIFGPGMGAGMAEVPFQGNAIRLAAPVAQEVEPAAPGILEAISWHARERDDLTLEDAVEAFRHGYKKVHQREDRAMLLQLIYLMASAPASVAQEVEQPSNPVPRVGGEEFKISALGNLMRVWASLYVASDVNADQAYDEVLRYIGIKEFPSESVGGDGESVNTPEFRYLLSTYIGASKSGQPDAFTALITHITTWADRRTAGVRRDAYKAAEEACENERVERTGTEGDKGYNMAIDHCATAIRSLSTAAPEAAASEGGVNHG